MNDSKFKVVPSGKTLVVPRAYEHATTLSEMGHRVASYGARIVDWSGFSNPTHVLVVGEEFEVCVCEQVAHYASSDELIHYLEGEQAVFTGIQGAILVAKTYVIPLEFGVYLAVDHPNALWRDKDGVLRMPAIRILPDIWDVGVVDYNELHIAGSRSIFLRPVCAN